MLLCSSKEPWGILMNIRSVSFSQAQAIAREVISEHTNLDSATKTILEDIEDHPKDSFFIASNNNQTVGLFLLRHSLHHRIVGSGNGVVVKSRGYSSIDSISITRHIKRSMRFCRTTLTCSSHHSLCDLSCRDDFQRW